MGGGEGGGEGGGGDGAGMTAARSRKTSVTASTVTPSWAVRAAGVLETSSASAASAACGEAMRSVAVTRTEAAAAETITEEAGTPKSAAVRCCYGRG